MNKYKHFHIIVSKHNIKTLSFISMVLGAYGSFWKEAMSFFLSIRHTGSHVKLDKISWMTNIRLQI